MKRASKRALVFLRDHGPSSAVDVAEMLGVCSRAATGRLYRLQRDGWVIRFPWRPVPPRPPGGQTRFLWRLRSAWEPAVLEMPWRKQSVYFPGSMLDEIIGEAKRLNRSVSWVLGYAWRRARPVIAAETR